MRLPLNFQSLNTLFLSLGGLILGTALAFGLANISPAKP